MSKPIYTYELPSRIVSYESLGGVWRKVDDNPSYWLRMEPPHTTPQDRCKERETERERERHRYLDEAAMHALAVLGDSTATWTNHKHEGTAKWCYDTAYAMWYERERRRLAEKEAHP